MKKYKCICLTNNYVPVRYEVIGYGRSLNVGVSFKKREIAARYDYACDSGNTKSLGISYCPFCGRKLIESEVKRMTNRDKLKAMSNEELAKSLSHTSCRWCINRRIACDNVLEEVCEKNIEKWLEQVVEE